MIADMVGAGWHHDWDTGLTSRNPVPEIYEDTDSERLMGLPEGQLRMGTAVHEAAHAVVMLHFGLPFVEVGVGNMGGGPNQAGAVIRESGTVQANHYLYTLAAGERAQDRWLRLANLWTPTRGWVVESGAFGDRREIARVVKQVTGADLTFGVTDTPDTDLAALHAVADEILTFLWGRVTALAEALHHHGRLTEAEAAAAAGLAALSAGGAR
ncbi:hypothetical protein [Kitasatospora sp. NPDC101183]|uniref:hypothetical protein n=1 Tax=Kitasatospora sp. NPDC101183 TaxID=3364100 RepID=UPI0037FD6A12